MDKICEKKRIMWIDMSKGIAILLVVIGHVLRGFTSAGMYDQYQNILDYVDYTIYSFHVPLFFLASGLLYSYTTRIDTMDEYKKFIKKKAKVLVIPYFIFSWLQLGIKLIMSDSVNHKIKLIDFFTIIYRPVEQFWFLYALVTIFIVVGFCDYKIKDERIKLIIFILGYLFIYNVSILSDVFQYGIYFYLGRFILKIKANNALAISTIICYCVANILLYKVTINNFLLNQIEIFILALLGILMIVLICSIVSRNKIFEILGRYLMPIFLLHTIFSAGTRIILIKLHLNNIFIQASCGIMCGIIAPIILYILYKNIKSQILLRHV